MRKRTAQLRAENAALREQLRALQKEKDEHFASSRPDNIPSPPIDPSPAINTWSDSHGYFRGALARYYESAAPQPAQESFDNHQTGTGARNRSTLNWYTIGTSPTRVIIDERDQIQEI